MIVTSESATVYRGGGRRWLTRKAAYYGAAKAIVRAACCCERDEPDVGYMGDVCRFHNTNLLDDRGRTYGSRVRHRLARWLRWLDATRTTAPTTGQE